MTRDSVDIVTVSGAELVRFIPDLARLRIEVFREFPYLYEGDLAYETGYLETYGASAGSVFVLARAGERVLGAATGVPMADEEEAFLAPIRAYGLDPATTFYFGESVLERSYRGRGLGVRFFEEREAFARRRGYTHAAFCAVARAHDDPRRPPDYQPLDGFWQRRGFRPVPALSTSYSWKELGEQQAAPKPMNFWLKELAR